MMAFGVDDKDMTLAKVPTLLLMMRSSDCPETKGLTNNCDNGFPPAQWANHVEIWEFRLEITDTSYPAQLDVVHRLI